MPLNRKWRSMDFFGSQESLNKGQGSGKRERPVTIYEKPSNQPHRSGLKNPFRQRLPSIGSKDHPAPVRDGDPPDFSGLSQKCIIIQRDDKGYGFTVSGDNPVFVASVKQDGAAAKAGVQIGDRIIKVNGTLVTQKNHLDVVKLIKSCHYVVLTLLGKPPTFSTSTVSSNKDSHPGKVTTPQSADATSLPTPSTSDFGSMSDSPPTSPSVSPTPTDSSSRHNGQDMEDSVISQSEIIHIDDEEVNSEDDQMCDPGPFVDMKMLENKPAHLAVFLNYLISNSDPSPALFHIISELYQKTAASVKELRKWAYEIFSTFIYKKSPLSITVEDNIITQIDNILVNSSSKSECESALRTMFQLPRQLVQQEIGEQLIDFRCKKDLGMGSLYGVQKLYDNMDRSAEVRVAEELLLPHLKYFGASEGGLVVDRDLATGWALATFLRSLGGKSVNTSTMERMQAFMTKDKKSIKFPGSRSSRAKAVKGHQLNLQHFYMTTFCKFCGTPVWGVGYQGYQCQNCEIVLHKNCSESIVEHCGGKHKRRASSLFPHPESTAATARKQGPAEVKTPASTETAPPGISMQPFPKQDEAELAGFPSPYSVKSMVKHYHGLNGPGGAPGPNSLVTALDSQQVATTATLVTALKKDRRGSKDLTRTGSLNNKEEKSDRPARRSNSDIVMDAEALKTMNQSGSSSASSLSNRSLESQSISSDNISDLLRLQLEDPDLELEPDLPPLKQLMSEDILRKLKPKDKKRQEVINELFYTERAHLRNLKVLDLLFNRPMLQNKDIVELASALFPNMEEMITLHVTFVKEIKDRYLNVPFEDVGDLLLNRFDGDSGDQYRNGCAQYCRNQSFALEHLRKQTRKDPKLQQFLHDAESNSLCRRLQLKDLIPSQMQRLTKYPLLIDNLMKYTKSSSEEYKKLERSLEKCKYVLAYVNQAVREVENFHKLKEVQKKLDRRSVDGLSDRDPALRDIKNLDFNQHKLIFDGSLTWKLTRNHRPLDMYVLLMDDILVLLQKQDERYILKCQNTNAQPTREDKYTHYPVLKLHNLLARTLATDKKSFFVVNISESRAQMYEFTAASSDLRVKWCKLINDKADECKKKANAQSQVNHKEHLGIDRNRPTRISRKGRSGGGVHTTLAERSTASPVREPSVSEVNESLRQQLNLMQDEQADRELISPEQVNVSQAVITQSAAGYFSEAVLTPMEGVLVADITSSTAQTVYQESLSSIAGLQESPENVVTAAGGAELQLTNTTYEQEDVSSQQEVDVSRSITPELTESVEPVSSGLLSPESSTTESVPDQEPTLATSSAPEQNTDFLLHKYGLDNTPFPDPHEQEELDSSLNELEQVLLGTQEVAVGQLEEIVEPLGVSHNTTSLVPVVATEMRTSQPDLSEECIETIIRSGDEDDDDDNEVSVAGLPLPDVISAEAADILSSQIDTEIIDDHDIENEDLDSLTLQTNYLDLGGLTPTLEDVDGEEQEGHQGALSLTSDFDGGGDGVALSLGLKDGNSEEPIGVDLDHSVGAGDV